MSSKEVFYNDVLNTEMSLENDLQRWLDGEPSLCEFPCVLTAASKARILQADAALQMRSVAHRAFMQHHHRSPFLVLQVRSFARSLARSFVRSSVRSSVRSIQHLRFLVVVCGCVVSCWFELPAELFVQLVHRCSHTLCFVRLTQCSKEGQPNKNVAT